MIIIRVGTGFESYHPYVLFLYFLFVGTLAMYLKHPVFLFTALLIMIIVILLHRGSDALKKWAPYFILFGSIMILLNPFLVSRGTNILFYFRGKQVTLEATVYGIVMSLSIIAILLMFVFFNMVLNGNKFIFILGRILPKTAFLIMLSVRFIPLLRERFDEIESAQRVKGTSIRSGSIINRIKSGMLFIQILLSWSLEGAIVTSDGMKARGYGTGKRSSYIPYRMQGRDWFSISILTLLFVVCLFFGSLGYGKIVIYPELGTLRFYLFDWVVYICMILLLAFPIMIEGREKFRWTFSH